MPSRICSTPVDAQKPLALPSLAAAKFPAFQVRQSPHPSSTSISARWGARCYNKQNAISSCLACSTCQPELVAGNSLCSKFKTFSVQGVEQAPSSSDCCSKTIPSPKSLKIALCEAGFGPSSLPLFIGRPIQAPPVAMSWDAQCLVSVQQVCDWPRTSCQLVPNFQIQILSCSERKKEDRSGGAC